MKKNKTIWRIRWKILINIDTSNATAEILHHFISR